MDIFCDDFDVEGNVDLSDFTKEVERFAASLPALLKAKHSV